MEREREKYDGSLSTLHEYSLWLYGFYLKFPFLLTLVFSRERDTVWKESVRADSPKFMCTGNRFVFIGCFECLLRQCFDSIEFKFYKIRPNVLIQLGLPFSVTYVWAFYLNIYAKGFNTTHS